MMSLTLPPSRMPHRWPSTLQPAAAPVERPAGFQCCALLLGGVCFWDDSRDLTPVAAHDDRRTVLHIVDVPVELRFEFLKAHLLFWHLWSLWSSRFYCRLIEAGATGRGWLTWPPARHPANRRGVRGHGVESEEGRPRGRGSTAGGRASSTTRAGDGEVSAAVAAACFRAGLPGAGDDPGRGTNGPGFRRLLGARPAIPGPTATPPRPTATGSPPFAPMPFVKGRHCPRDPDYPTRPEWAATTSSAPDDRGSALGGRTARPPAVHHAAQAGAPLGRRTRGGPGASRARRVGGFAPGTRRRGRGARRQVRGGRRSPSTSSSVRLVHPGLAAGVDLAPSAAAELVAGPRTEACSG